MEESVCAIIFDKEKKRVLLIKRRDIPVWVLPGGGIETGEEPEAAALREAEEESGLKLKIIRKVAFYIPTNKLTRPTHFYECERVAGTPKTGPETGAIDFFELDALPKTLVPFYKTWIDDALLFSPEVLQKKIQKTSYWTFLHYLVCHPVLVIRFLLTRIGIHVNQKT
ncbi:MAG: NUDIX domain-containing protein [Verrucomicrobia bacterium]|nr:NUDIX domain-containing protein [Verrucomicrobiota bacterium]